ncbi:hypothetical protein [Maribacter sp. 2308TA10-17]|uniref:hypothetical protein n=1 Tax=Maribacter sp. 2308TA10-17 TaxID=3386276 RepID=UPI0039BCA9A6
MNMIKFILTAIILIFSLNSYCQTKITSEDLKLAVGNWEGSITYLDYQSNTPFTMPANLLVEEGNNSNTLVLNNSYPNEPKANNSDKIKIGKNGLLLNKHAVTSREGLENGGIQIQTEHDAKDDGKKARIRYTYSIEKNVFVILKEVQFAELADWIKRSEFRYTRKK